MVAQQFDTKRISVNKNSGSGIIKKIVHVNSEGFIWYSTYDGYVYEQGNFRKFFPFNYPDSSKVAQVNDIHQSTKKILWISTKKGAFKRDLITDDESWFPVDKKDIAQSKRIQLTGIFEDSQDHIWFGTNDKYIYTYDGGTLQSIPINTDVNFSETTHTSIEGELQNGSLLIRQDNNWYHYEKDTIKLLKKIEAKGSYALKNGAFLPKNESGIFTYKGKKYNFWYMPSIDMHITEFPFSSKSNIIESNASKIYIQNKYSVEEFIFQIKKNGVELVKKREIKSRLEISSFDLIDNDIVTMDNNDLMIYRTVNQFFSKELTRSSARGFYQNDQKDIYLATFGALYYKEFGSSDFNRIYLKNIFTGKFNYIFGLSKYPFETMMYNFESISNNQILIYGYSNELIIANLNKREFDYIFVPSWIEKIKPNILVSQFNTFDVTRFDKNNMFIGGDYGLHLLNLTSREVTDINMLNEEINLSDHVVRDIFYDKESNALWVGTKNHGLYLKKLDSEEVYHFSKNSIQYPLCNDNVEYIFKDKESIIWVATKGGLQRIDPLTLRSENKSKDKGFRNLHLVGILENKKTNDLWISTYDGLVKYNKDTEEVKNFYEINGVIKNEFNSKSFFITKDSLFYFGGIEGIVSFNPNEIDEGKNNAFLSLSNFTKYDPKKKKRTTFFDYSQSLNYFKLPYDKNYLELSFAINDVSRIEDCVFQYKIEELENEWINSENFNKIQLQGLRPGTYHLTSRGIKSNGQFTNSLSYIIEVEDIFYNTWWFRISLIIVLISIVLFWAQRRKQIYLEKFETETQIQKLELKALQAQMNPHFIFNCLNGIQSAVVLKGSDAADKYFGAFANLLRYTLNMTKLESVTLQEEIQYLKAYIELEKMFQNLDIETSFEVEPKLEIESMKVPCMLFQPVIENAIKHGLIHKNDDKKLRVQFFKKESLLIVTITDNGIGRKLSMSGNLSKNNNHLSWATRILNERIKLLNREALKNGIAMEITDLYEDEISTGTQVVFNIPI